MTDTTTQAVHPTVRFITEREALYLQRTALLAERDALAAQLAAAHETLRMFKAWDFPGDLQDMAVRLEAAERRAREASLDALAAYGQAADAHAAQLAAEQRLATARADALEEAARVCDEMHNDWRRTDVKDAAAAIRALAKGGEA